MMWRGLAAEVLCPSFESDPPSPGGGPAGSQTPASFLPQARQLLRHALALGHLRDQAALSPAEFDWGCQRLHAEAEALLEPAREESHEEAVRQRQRKQRDHLFTFLDHPGLDVTNNLAERQWRPAVIARKLSLRPQDRERRAHLSDPRLPRRDLHPDPHQLHCAALK